MPGHPQLSASMNLKKGPIWGPFLISATLAGDSNPQKKRRPLGRLVGVVFDTAPALYLGRLGYGLAFGRERAVVDAAA